MKTVSFLGDSISTFAGFVPADNEVYYPAGDVDTVEKTWWHQVLASTGFALGINQSYSGSRVTCTGIRPSWSAFTSDERLATLAGDMVVILGGVNDCCQTVDVPTYGQFTEAYGELVEKLTDRLPASEIFCCTIFPFPSWPAELLNSTGWNQLDMNGAIRRIASSDERVHLIDLEQLPMGKDKTLFYDGTVHPSAAGMDIIAGHITQVLLR